MARKISMSEGTRVAERASTEIEAWLREWHGTVNLENVEGDPDYQKIDVDLLWTTITRDYKIEVKADRWHETGNFFFETVSNKEKGTPVGSEHYTTVGRLVPIEAVVKEVKGVKVKHP